jgi:hypothetical protein
MRNERPTFYATSLLFVILTLSATAPAQFISGDTYTRYELLAPETHQF